MTTPTRSRYTGHRFPPEVIGHAVWLYFRFPLGLRMVEEMLAARGIVVSHETVRHGPASSARRSRTGSDDACPGPATSGTWTRSSPPSPARSTGCGGQAVDQDGIVLDVLVQSRRDKRAAKRLLRKLLKRQGREPRVMVTDKLASYPAAKKELIPGVEHRRHEGLNDRAENSHQPTRRRERQMRRFKSAGQAQRFLSAHDQINNLFQLRRDHVTASAYRAARTRAFELWAEITGVAAAA